MVSNLAQLLVDRAGTRPDLAIGAIDDQIELRAALELASVAAQGLAERGVAADRPVALIATNSTGYLINWMSVILAGVPVALINPQYPVELINRIVNDLKPALVIADEGKLAEIEGGFPVEYVDSVREGRPGRPTPQMAGLQSDAYATASIMLTSGTTGTPKYCAQSHEYFLRLGRTVAGTLGLKAEDRVFAPLPLFHINPLGYGVIGALTASADVLTVPKFSASKFWDQVIQNQITALILHIPPTEILKRSTTAADAAGHRVRIVYCSDGDFVRQFGIPTSVTGYGSTEAAGITNTKFWSEADTTPSDSIRYGGLPRPDIELRLADGGEIFVRELEPYAMFSGYLRADGLDSARDKDGWFATGDRGEMHDDGGIIFVDRFSESIRVSGEYVPVSYVEEQISAVSGVVDAVVWKGAPDPHIFGDNMIVFVVADPLPVAAITEVVQRLPRFMRPRAIAQVDQIPRDTAVGKAQRRRLGEQVVRHYIALET